MSHLLGIHWMKYHQDGEDFHHIERMGYKSATLFQWMWNNADFCHSLKSVMPGDAVFLCRDHPLSEQWDRFLANPAECGRGHANEWEIKLRAAQVHTPIDRTLFLGLNEPDSNTWQRQIDQYNEAFCRRMAEHGLRACAYSFGVGHPSTVNLQPDTLPDWSWYAASARAVLEGGHWVAVHEYGSPTDHGWGYWCDRLMHCPYPFTVIVQEAGIDGGVIGQPKHGYLSYMTPAQYMPWLDTYQKRMQAAGRKAKVHSIQPFTYDANTDWHSFNIRLARLELEIYPWTPVQPPIIIDTGPTPPAEQPIARGKIFASNGLNVRAAPGIDAERVGGLDYGATVNVYETRTHLGVPWLRIGPGLWINSIWVELEQQPLPPEPELPLPPTPFTFDSALAFVLRWEGGWADNPNDPGGATMKGITIGTYTRWRQAHGQPPPTKDDLRNISDAEVRQIYHDWYWVPSGAHAMASPMSLAHFDLAVNGGVARAQEALAAAGDNFLRYNAWRLAWYTRIAGWPHFGAAWTRRVADLMEEAT